MSPQIQTLRIEVGRMWRLYLENCLHTYTDTNYFTCFRVENSHLKCVQAFWFHSMFIYTVNLKRGLYSQVCKLNCWCTVLYILLDGFLPVCCSEYMTLKTTPYDVFSVHTVLYILPDTVSYRYAAVNIRLSTQLLTTYLVFVLFCT